MTPFISFWGFFIIPDLNQIIFKWPLCNGLCQLLILYSLLGHFYTSKGKLIELSEKRRIFLAISNFRLIYIVKYRIWLVSLHIFKISNQWIFRARNLFGNSINRFKSHITFFFTDFSDRKLHSNKWWLKFRLLCFLRNLWIVIISALSRIFLIWF